MMKGLFFKVYAGNMFCGLLWVNQEGLHIFNGHSAMYAGNHAIDNLKKYKKLKLLRVQ